MSVALKFNEINKSYANECGGKGSMLGELTALASSLSMHAEVPSGFVFTADLFGQWLTSAGVKDENITAALNHAGTDINKLKEISTLLRNKLKEQALPNEAADIITQYTGDFLYAVRSSGIGEDAGESSFAGQHDTFLKTPRGKILERTRDVWLSAFGERALFYRVKHGLTANPIRQAVVVQRMVDPEIAGVAFSVDPRTGSTKHALVEYVKGLGDKLVEGSVTPESIMFDKAGTKIPEKHVAVPAVAKAVIELEKILGWPVDMEWAWRDNTLFLLQARPITALPEALPEDKLKGLMLVHSKWGHPLVVGEAFSNGEITALGYITREQAIAALKDSKEEKSFELPYRVLAVPFTTPDDLPVMEKVAGIVVTEGGLTSHAAIVCRELGKPCIKVSSLKDLGIKEDFELKPILLDGDNGCIYDIKGWENVQYRG